MRAGIFPSVESKPNVTVFATVPASHGRILAKHPDTVAAAVDAVAREAFRTAPDRRGRHPKEERGPDDHGDSLLCRADARHVDHNPDRTRDAAQVYRSCTDDLRRLLNHALFRRLYLADSRITNHQPWPTAPLT